MASSPKTVFTVSVLCSQADPAANSITVNVFAPAKAKKTAALPVYVFIQGGGFNDNGNANYNGSGLIQAADEQMVVVNFNYRVGPYGFLAGKEITENKALSLNNGLKDQRQLLKWVKTYINEVSGSALVRGLSTNDIV